MHVCVCMCLCDQRRYGSGEYDGDRRRGRRGGGSWRVLRPLYTPGVGSCGLDVIE